MYKRQGKAHAVFGGRLFGHGCAFSLGNHSRLEVPEAPEGCLLYTSDAADDLPRVELGGRRLNQKKQL